MAKKNKNAPEGLADFYRAIQGVKPLKHKLKVSLKKKTQPLVKRPNQKPEDDDEEFFSDATYLDPVEGDAFIEYKQPSIAHKILRKLRKGQYNVEAMLDLHGMTVDEARIAVETFLFQCIHEGIRVVIIVHGKGKHGQVPILKNRLNHWLREFNWVLAFCSATAFHGSRGAMYVLLKRATI